MINAGRSNQVPNGVVHGATSWSGSHLVRALVSRGIPVKELFSALKAL